MKPSPDIAYRSARILIVDDERTNRQLMEVMLAPKGGSGVRQGATSTEVVSV